MLGDGPLRPQVENEITHQKLGDRITLRGWVEPDVVLAEFARSDILFMPSRSEGLPVVGVQALASGMAIIAGNSGGFVDLVEPAENGFLYDPDDTEGMCRGMGELFNEPEFLFNSRIQSLEIAKRFDLSAIVSSYEELFSRVINY